MRYLPVILTLLFIPVFAGAAVAANGEAPTDAAAPTSTDLPPPPTDSLTGEIPEPEVRIITRPQETVEEYRVGGSLYMIKVTPKQGAAYYLVDTDGDGNLETQRSALEPRMAIPGWVILRWK